MHVITLWQANTAATDARVSTPLVLELVGRLTGVVGAEGFPSLNSRLQSGQMCKRVWGQARFGAWSPFPPCRSRPMIAGAEADGTGQATTRRSVFSTAPSLAWNAFSETVEQLAILCTEPTQPPSA